MPQVLLVEDNALNRKMLDRQLRHCGYDVLIATDGDKGVSIAIEHQPDLIIMDTDLPVIDGWQAIKILKASSATLHIPVIALTTNAKTDNWKTALEVGCNDYDTKPIVLKRLLSKINALLGVTLPSPSLAKNPSAEMLQGEQIDKVLSKLVGADIDEILTPVSTQVQPSDGCLNNRYEVSQVLSNNPFGQCLLANDLQTTPLQSVIINTFNLPVDNPSLLALVREALTSEMSFLRVITRQDEIATCLDYFEQDDVFYWVQAYVEGTSLADELGSAQSMGYVLQLTHSLLSSVNPFHQGQMVHCECNPSSFIRRQSDNRIVLVEYGVLKRLFVKLRSHSLPYRQALLKQHDYQSAEQRVGNPQLNSDIYAIGMIVLQSLTGQSPEWLLTVSGKQNLTDLVKADANIVKLFERMINSNYHLRFKSAGEALKALPLGLIPKKNAYQQAISS
ncbi:response regulator with -like receiver domain protein and winged-helix dna-binding domain protein [Leptolyngbya sp. Heron Island J]|uniref:response regulator n=1 Tax=Leptolyngbya sp. Heron Island J TaxID=1385935 RepID=UPI0003B99509|nr:response regulator [Leptolyngbya sp. Heron Island J]ESA37089.1 response regulator with -like receiver domain protein and winged-helix dna-binding domain protein [Leptolyngbya sp. Heron Island J]